MLRGLPPECEFPSPCLQAFFLLSVPSPFPPSSAATMALLSIDARVFLPPLFALVARPLGTSVSVSHGPVGQAGLNRGS